MGYNVTLKAACKRLFIHDSWMKYLKTLMVISGVILEFDEWYLDAKAPRGIVIWN